MTLQKQLDDMAKGLIEEATTKDMGLKERIEIFKAASAWHLGMRKPGKRDEDEAGQSQTFTELRQRINGKKVTQ